MAVTAATARAGRCLRAALGAALPLLATLAPARAATPADAVITALRIEQGRHCVVVAARAPDGRAKVTVRGDFCDGRRFLAAVFAALAADDAPAAQLDIDLDIEVEALAGFNNEALRNLSLQFTVRGGDIETFALAAKLANADVSGELRGGAGRRRVVLATDDAGALLRLVDRYRAMRGGRLLIVMSADMPARTAEGAARDGVANLTDFTIVDGPHLKPLTLMLVGRRRAGHMQLAVSRLRFAFTARPGKVVVPDGVFLGSLAGASLAGSLDMARNRLDLGGVMLPMAQFAGPATFLLQLRGGLIGSSYALSGPPSAPRLHIDPLMSVQPDLLRELLAFGPGDDHPVR